MATLFYEVHNLIRLMLNGFRTKRNRSSSVEAHCGSYGTDRTRAHTQKQPLRTDNNNVDGKYLAASRWTFPVCVQAHIFTYVHRPETLYVCTFCAYIPATKWEKMKRWRRQRHRRIITGFETIMNVNGSILLYNCVCWV